MPNRYLKMGNTCNYMNKIVLTLMISLFMFSFVAAESETYKINTETNLQFTCVLNNEIAQSGSTFNITITDREGNYLVDNQQTEEQRDGAFNYTVTFPKAEKYKVKMFCTDGTYSYLGEGEYNITPSGIIGTLGFTFIILILSLGIMAFGFAIKDAPIVILSSFGLYFVGLYTLFFGIDGIKDPVYTWAIGIIVLMLAAYVSIRSAYELIVD